MSEETSVPDITAAEKEVDEEQKNASVEFKSTVAKSLRNKFYIFAYADAFIQSSLHCILSVHTFPENQTYDLGITSAPFCA